MHDIQAAVVVFYCQTFRRFRNKNNNNTIYPYVLYCTVYIVHIHTTHYDVWRNFNFSKYISKYASFFLSIDVLNMGQHVLEICVQLSSLKWIEMSSYTNYYKVNATSAPSMDTYIHEKWSIIIDDH